MRVLLRILSPNFFQSSLGTPPGKLGKSCCSSWTSIDWVSLLCPCGSAGAVDESRELPLVPLANRVNLMNLRTSGSFDHKKKDLNQYTALLHARRPLKPRVHSYLQLILTQAPKPQGQKTWRGGEPGHLAELSITPGLKLWPRRSNRGCYRCSISNNKWQCWKKTFYVIENNLSVFWYTTLEKSWIIFLFFSKKIMLIKRSSYVEAIKDCVAKKCWGKFIDDKLMSWFCNICVLVNL